jgi:trehalose/maltose transport system substrate-binding protein
MKQKRMGLTNIMVLGLIVLLVACGAGQTTDTAPPMSPTTEANETPTAAAIVARNSLKVYLLDFTAEELAAYEPIFEQFTTEIGVEVEVFTTWGTGEDYLSGIQQALDAGSSEFDIFIIDVVWAGILAEHALDMSSYVTAEEAAAHIPAILENYTVDGKLVALPFQADAGVLYYRTDLLEKYGFDGPPATWDELEEMAAGIQAGERGEGNDEFWGFVWQGTTYEGLTCDALEWQVSHDGGRIIEPDGAITINNPGAVAAFERAAGWVGTISPPDSVEYDEQISTAAWLNGNAAFMRNWPYVIHIGNNDDTLKGRFGITVLPTDGETRAATLGGWALMVSKYSSRPDAAARLAQLLAGPEGQKQNTLVAGFLPTIEALYRDPEVLPAQPHLADMLPVVQSAVPRPSTVTGAQYAEVSAAYYNHVHRILTAEVSAAEGVADLEAELIDITGFEARMP